jgi:hypothetical protein
MLTMIYMTRIQNMSFFLLKVNNPSVRHPVWPVGHFVWPRRAPRLATPLAPSSPPSGHPVRPPPSGHPVRPPVGHPVRHLVQPRLAPRLATRLAPVGHPVWPRRAPRPAAVGSKKKKFSFRFSIPKISKIPELRGLRGRSREKKKVFLA